MLNPGTEIEVVGHGWMTVGRCLGEGGQGIVFEAHDRSNQPFALKWYKNPPPDQEVSLDYLVDRGAPSDRFLWPLGLARCSGVPNFGYLMRLRPSDYLGLPALLDGKDEHGRQVDVPFSATIRMSFQLSRSFLKLHSLGLCYRDINRGNVFFEPRSGAVLICDNDNVGIDGSPSWVLGAGWFMAPEVYRFIAAPQDPQSALPSARTDRHSLAVTLFMILMIAHPLDGRKTVAGPVDDAWELEHFGIDPVFIFDPNDDRNRPPEATPANYWKVYPTFLRALFTRAFTIGLRKPDKRVLENEWATAMLRLRDSMITCPTCGGTIFHDWDDPTRPCARCWAALPAPLVLQIGRHRIALRPGSCVWTDHFGGDQDTATPVGELVQHPQHAEWWGLQNRTNRAWLATAPDGTVHEVPPGKRIMALPGTRIRFGDGQGLLTR
ncbi:MAG: protein kinase domain-containing protein [Egibacteraceae bacterium]